MGFPSSFVCVSVGSAVGGFVGVSECFESHLLTVVVHMLPNRLFVRVCVGWFRRRESVVGNALGGGSFLFEQLCHGVCYVSRSLRAVGRPAAMTGIGASRE